VTRGARRAVAAVGVGAAFGGAAPGPGLAGDTRVALQYRARLRDVVASIAARPDLVPVRRYEAPRPPGCPGPFGGLEVAGLVDL
jgi:hypothetical protein